MAKSAEAQNPPVNPLFIPAGKPEMTEGPDGKPVRHTPVRAPTDGEIESYEKTAQENINFMANRIRELGRYISEKMPKVANNELGQSVMHLRSSFQWAREGFEISIARMRAAQQIAEEERLKNGKPSET